MTTESKPKESPPLLLLGAVLSVVGVSAAVPAALYVQSSREPHATISGEAEAGAGPSVMTPADPAPLVAPPPPPVTSAAASAAPPPSATSPASAASTASPASAAPVASVAASASASASAKPASSDADGPGFFTILTTPSARVSERGRVLCTTTPCAKLPLPPGAHTITLENKEDSSKTVIVVTITSGEITTRRVTLK